MLYSSHTEINFFERDEVFLVKLTKDNLYQTVDTQYQAHKDSFEAISDYIFRHPEVGGEEIQSATYLTQVLKKYGFSVSNPAVQLPTAFMAQYGPGTGLTIAFVAEYDALPGFGPNGGPDTPADTTGSPPPCAPVPSAWRMPQTSSACASRSSGAPAEETFGAKYDLIQAGVFQGVDFVFQAHLDEFNSLETLFSGYDSLEFDFHGFPAHAAQNPEKGINALDAVIIMFNSVNAMLPAAPPERPRPPGLLPTAARPPTPFRSLHSAGSASGPKPRVIWPKCADGC